MPNSLSALPTEPAVLGVAYRKDRCPSCGHSAEESDADSINLGLVAWARRVLGMRPARARCQVREYGDDYEYSGLSPLTCDCDDAYHGS